MTATKPDIITIILDVLTHARSLYGLEGAYRWQCGIGVRQMIFEAGVTIAIKPVAPEDVKPRDDGGFTLCGLSASVSTFTPDGRLELYLWDENMYENRRIALIEFPVTRHF